MPRPRSYSFDHFKAPKRLPTERMDITTKPSLKGATHKGKKKGVPPSELEALHYGMEHAETVLLAQEHRRRGSRGPGEERRVVKSPTSQPAALKAPSLRAAAGKPMERGRKTIARVLAAAKRKVSRAAGKSPARRRATKR
jgi:hypothetical protein